MNPARSQEFNKNVVMVYSEEVGFSGYKSLEERKINNIEETMSGVLDYSKRINEKIQTTGDLYTGIIVHQMDLNAIYDNIDIGGYAGAEISGLGEAVYNNFPVYDSIQIKYDESNNTTGVFYKTNNFITREIKIMYNGSLITGIFKTDY